MKTYKINIHPYGQVLHVFVGAEKEFPVAIRRVFGDVAKMEEHGFYDISHLCGLFTQIEDTKKQTKDYVIWLRGAKRNSEDILTISHEALHCTFTVLRDMGIKLSKESEESYTYLQEYLTREIMKKVL